MNGVIASRHAVPSCCHALPVSPRWDGHELHKEWCPAGVALQRDGRCTLRTVMRWDRPAVHSFLSRKSTVLTYTLGSARLQACPFLCPARVSRLFRVSSDCIHTAAGCFGVNLV